ncbi:hypothetical protein LJC53_07950 [Bacteroidales bacterium OttesenSCG-928-C03]|nr:hypothetical protein [Bacteroidales bacterium OttesenSCG-928-C03]
MKKIALLLILALGIRFGNAQNCIDFVIIQSEIGDNKKTDTIFCKILSQEGSNVVIDNGYAISTITKDIVLGTKLCAREMSASELYIFKGIDFVTKDYFKNNATVGNYLRKASQNAYLATGLGIAGSVGIVLGTTVFEDSKSKNAWIIGGGIVCASSLFFLTLSWNNIYKAGKLLDINENNALYLTPGQHGGLGIALRFK